MQSNLNENDDYRIGVSSRGTPLEFTTVYDVIEILKAKAPYYFEMVANGKLAEYQKIYRGAGHLSKESPKYSAVKTYDPKKHKRHSAYTENYYTEIMDNSKYWKGYPNRSNSIVGSTNKKRAATYGTLYHVIPLQVNSKIAIAPSHDIWGSFDFALKKMDELFKEDMAIPVAVPDFESMGGFNNFLKTKFGLSKEADYSELKKKVILNEEAFKQLDRESTWNNSRFDYDKNELIRIQNKWGSLLNFIEYLLSPKWNNFELIEYNKQVMLPDSKEVWTDSECLLIEHNIHEKVLEALK